MTALEKLRGELCRLEIFLPEATERLLLTYLRELERWNTRMNLTSLTGAARISRLIAEPLWIARQLSPRGGYLDIGSGNASPAIPWHLSCGFLKTTLVEAHQRRAVFLRRLAVRLDQPNVAVEAGRLEEVAPSLAPPDWVTLQGIRLNSQLFEQIRLISKKNARLVWITGDTDSPVAPHARLPVPQSDRVALIFQL